MTPPDGTASGSANVCYHDQSRLGVPVLTFIVRVVPVRESLSGGTMPYGGTFFALIRFIRGDFYAHCVDCFWLLVPVPTRAGLLRSR